MPNFEEATAFLEGVQLREFLQQQGEDINISGIEIGQSCILNPFFLENLDNYIEVSVFTFMFFFVLGLLNSLFFEF